MEEQFVTLTIGEQLCGVPVLTVRDVLAAQPIARIPLAPTHIAGSLNLRGRIVTAVDLRRRLELPPTPDGAAQMSVVTEQEGELYALLVDKVAEVISVPAEAYEPNPPTLSATWAAVSDGIYRLEGTLLMALNMRRVLELPPSPGALRRPLPQAGAVSV